MLALLAAALVGGATAPALAQGAAAETAGSVSSREADGLQIELRPSTVVSRTGDLVPYVLTVRDAAADSYRLEVIYSDGTAYETAMQVLCASDKGGSLNKTFDLSHAYRLPGTYVLTVRVQTDGCGAESESATATSAAVVTPGPATTNGGAVPTLFIDKLRSDPRDRRKVATEVNLGDGEAGRSKWLWRGATGSERPTRTAPGARTLLSGSLLDAFR